MIVRTVSVVIVGACLWALPGAVDQEFAVAGGLSERVDTRGRALAPVYGGWIRSPARSESPSAGIGTSLIVTEAEYQGRNILWWARRAVQARKDANARGRTIRQLRRQRSFIPWYWVAVGSCESGLRWDYNGSSGFDGAFQFHPGTWSANRLPSYPRYAWQASPFQQLVVAELVLARQGWRAWPACSRKVGLR